LEFIGNKLKKRKASYLFDLRQQFYSIKGYGQLIKKIFDRDINQSHIETAKNEGFELNILK